MFPNDFDDSFRWKYEKQKSQQFVLKTLPSKHLLVQIQRWKHQNNI